MQSAKTANINTLENFPLYGRMLFVTNSASHGHGDQAIVEGDVQEYKAMKYLPHRLIKNGAEKIVERDRDTTLFVAASSLCIDLEGSE